MYVLCVVWCVISPQKNYSENVMKSPKKKLRARNPTCLTTVEQYLPHPTVYFTSYCRKFRIEFNKVEIWKEVFHNVHKIVVFKTCQCWHCVYCSLAESIRGGQRDLFLRETSLGKIEIQRKKNRGRREDRNTEEGRSREILNNHHWLGWTFQIERKEEKKKGNGRKKIWSVQVRRKKI